MRVLAIPFLLWAVHAPAQLAFGMHGGLAVDHMDGHDRSLCGASAEFRWKLFPTAVCRVSLDLSPDAHDRFERYGAIMQPVEQHWLAYVDNERASFSQVALDLRFPFNDTLCSSGLYRGTYVFAGLGIGRRVLTQDEWWQDQFGVTRTSHGRHLQIGPMLRAGFGGEWNFRWGCPFIEGWLTVSGSGGDGLKLPAMIGISAGYRYCFVRNA